MRETPIEATQKYVHDVIFPASKDEVLGAMEHNGAPDDVMQVIRDLDKPRYYGPNEVHNALWMDT